MNRNFVVGMFGGLIGSAMLLLVLNAAGIVGARSADVTRSDVSHTNDVSAATPLTSTFTYQGQLKNGGTAVNGSCQMAFRLYDASSGSSLIGSPITTTVPVTNGLFTVGLNFGSNAFDGNGRWLDIQVDCGGGFVPLPRQAVTAAPYSLFAISTGALQSYPVTTTAPSSGQVLKWNGSAWIPGVDAGGTAYSAGFGLTLIGTQFKVVTSTIQQRVTGNCSAGQYVRSIDANGNVVCGLDANSGGTITNVTAGFGLAGGGSSGSIALKVVTSTIQQRVSGSCTISNAIRVINADGSVTCEPVSGDGFWGLTGNAGTNPATNFLGTTDNMTLTLRVSNTVALNIAPTDETPNLIGGFSANSISGSVNHGSVIGGGGSPVYGTNTIQGGDASYSTISGGVGNLISGTNVYNSVIGGGAGNVISGSFAARSTIGGGWSNTASGAYTFIGGGCCNTASNQWATIGGGPSNTASGNTATIGGGYNNTASSLYATISGGTGNTASGIGAFIGGGGYNGSFFGGNQALGNASTIGGGISNTIPITGNYAFIGGGISNTASGSVATIGGGASNIASGQYAAVGGGQGNTASGNGAFIGGGGTNFAGNQAHGNASIIGGGLNNTIPITGIYAFIGGGSSNTASGFEATVGGGGNNTASGQNATVGGGVLNTASDFGATVGGGAQNTASGDTSTIPGGAYNSATMTYTLAAGYRAKANHQGAFVWADSTNADFASTGNDQFLIRANGGVGINTSTPIATLDVNGKVHASGGFNGQCVTFGDWNFNNASNGSACNMDVAEGFASTELTAPGDLVALVTDANNTPTVRKSSNAYDELVIGVVSQNPGLVFDNGQTHLAGDNSQLITNDKTVVALVGRVNVKVSIENGAINTGDPLTSSSQPGIAMKATQAGKIIGYAMGSANANRTILALVQPGYYLPSDQLPTRTDSAPAFNWFNLLSLIAFAGFAAMWLQLRRMKEGVRS